MIGVLLLALALAMDAFAVSIGLGIKQKHNVAGLAIKVGILFGLFQAFMPLIGYLGGLGLKQYMSGYDTLIAFVLLVLIGGKMIYKPFGENTEDEITIISHKTLLMLAVATSIDAMAVGFTIHLFDLSVYMILIIIGIVTFLMSVLGTYIGQRGGSYFESRAETLGGLVLIVIGFKVLLL